MPCYVAFLRAINVGGHVVKMDRLRLAFEKLGFRNVETFIASGNVIFETRGTDAPKLEAQIEKCLRASLGYEVTTFIRTVERLRQIAQHTPFAAADPAHALSVAFLKAPPTAEAWQKVMKFRSDMDDFHVDDRELYWMSRSGRMSDSEFSGALLEKALGMPATMRNVNTVRRLADKCAAAKE